MALDMMRKMPESTYRQYLPDLNTPRFQAMHRQDAHEYVNDFHQHGNPPWLFALYQHWLRLSKEPFRGITTDSKVRNNLYQIRDEDVPIERIVSVANELLSKADDQQRLAMCFHIDDPQWRTWSNPEFLFSNKGIRLDEVANDLREAVMLLLRTTLSSQGYQKAISAMRINGFLGELVKGEQVCNEYSYNFCFFDEPCVTRPWGLSFYGHHLCLNMFFYQKQMLIGPWFTGAEPNIIDSGPYAGTRILHEEERLALLLMQSLSPDLQAKAQVYELMKDPKMGRGRWNHDDQRHLCGAYRDNRIVPYEGITVASMNHYQQQLILDILAQYLLYLPQKSCETYLQDCQRNFEETYFSWVGSFSDHDPFYFRIQNQIILVEFDHHSGVFLTNKEPAKFHIHTLLRLPNGGDYGHALRPLCGISDAAIGGVRQEFVWEADARL